jgi:hypothetical protein
MQQVFVLTKFKSMDGKYLNYDGESVEFTHHYVKKAVLLSSDHLLDHFLRTCSLIEIKDIVRSYKYVEKGHDLHNRSTDHFHDLSIHPSIIFCTMVKDTSQLQCL